MLKNPLTTTKNCDKLEQTIEAHAKISILHAIVCANVVWEKGFRAEEPIYARISSGNRDKISFAVAEMRRAIYPTPILAFLVLWQAVTKIEQSTLFAMRLCFFI